MKRLSRIDELRVLTDIEFDLELAGATTLKEVADKYGISSSMVSKEKHFRGMKRMESFRSTRGEQDLISSGSWMNSPERKAFCNAGLMKNKSVKYNN